MSLTSIARPASLLALELCTAPATLILLAVALLLDLGARALLPLGIASSATGAIDLSSELRGLLFLSTALLLLARIGQWGIAMRGLGDHERVVIVVLSGLYIHLFVAVALWIPEGLLFGGWIPPDWRLLGESLWLTSLAGILAQSRLEPRSLGLLYLLLAWFVPTLCMPVPLELLTSAKGIPLRAWSAEGILPMLVPPLLALGYVSVERAQR
jgi:hypothetical protein